MKLRIRGNSIRLRLSKGDVKTFEETGAVEEKIQFGISPSEQMIYRLVQSDVPKLKCEFKNNTVQVLVPKVMGKAWVSTQLVGMEHLDTIDENTQLRILIEKDFQCLHVRINEDEKDAYPHPKS